MRDYFKRARAKDGYNRFYCINKVARARAKRTAQKEIKEERSKK